MHKFVAAILIGAVLCCSPVFAFDVSPTTINTTITKTEPVQVQPEFIRKLLSKKSFGPGAIDLLTVTPDGAGLYSLRGELSSPLMGDLHEAARAFVLENADIFNLPANRNADYLKTVKFEQNGNFHHVGFQMAIDGVPVHHSSVELHIDKEKVISLINGAFPQIDEITNQINIGRYQAIGAARAKLGADKFRAVPDAQLRIVPLPDGTAKMAYVARLPIAEPLGDWEVIVDAETSEIMYMNNEMAYKTGRGAVFVTNPIRTKVTVEDLKNLTHNNLRGKYANIVNDNGTNAQNDNNEHIYDLDSEHFNEANMYLYVNNIHAFFSALGHTKHDRPMKAIVNLGTDYDNAYFSPWQNVIAFGNGSRFNDLAREAGIAYHEYSHAVLHSIVNLVYSAESGAINEGQADYFACSLTDDSMLGEWATAKMGKPFLRNVDNNYVYPKDIQGEVHHDGKIWGGTLWDIRKAIGARMADRLIYRSHHFLKNNRATFMDAYNALIMADKDLFNGKNLKTLATIMNRRGITAENYFGAVVTGEELSSMHRFLELHREF